MDKNSANINVDIRKATEKDLVPLKEVSIKTFMETFAKDNTPEDNQKYIDTNFTDEQILKEINILKEIFHRIYIFHIFI